MSKYIGDVSAYAYAVSKGYAGTEEEFAELMADYAEVGQRAEDAADRAEAALDEFTSVTADATTLPEGSSATAEYSDGHLTLGIPKGDKGDGAYHIELSGESFVIHTDASGVAAAQEFMIYIDARQGITKKVISRVDGLPSISTGSGTIAPEIIKHAFTGSVSTIIYTIPANTQISAGQINAQFMAYINDGTSNGFGVRCSLSVAVVKDGAKGDKGDTGDKGDKGDKGDTGNTGNTPNLTIGTVTTLQPTAPATATISGTADNPVLSFGIPKGDTGEVSQEQFDEALALKADAIGNYPDLAVGTAEQIDSDTVVSEDVAPYQFRQSISGASNRAYDEIVGGSLAVNQLAHDFIARAETLGITITVDNTKGSITASGTATATNNLYFMTALRCIQDHKYLFKGSKGNGWLGVSSTSARDTGNGAIFNVTACIVGDNQLIYGFSAGDVINETLYPQVFDLTAMFGTTIADYVYSLETATAGAGVEWLKAHFPRIFNAGYVPYNAGELVSVQASAHKMTGFNQWDEEWELGRINPSTGALMDDTTRIRSKNYIPVMPNVDYYFCCGSGRKLDLFAYDAEYNYIGVRTVSGFQPSSGAADNGNEVIRTPVNCHFMKLYCISSYGVVYNHDICINISDPAKDGTYEPYEAHSYPLDDSLELRGLPKLDADNNLVYDGDVYESTGNVTRRYGIVDLGTLNWTKDSGGYYQTRFPDDCAHVASYETLKAICSHLAVSSLMYAGQNDGYIGVYYYENGNANYARTKGSQYETPTGLKNALSGVYLVYELATPTTETAQPFTNPQVVDASGTEEYVTDSVVPVGHVTKYVENLKAKLESAPASPTEDGDYIVRQTDGVNEYVPLDSAPAITAKADVSELLKAFPVDTASGSIASFTDGAELPLKSLTVDIEPVQDGTGDPSPDNVRPISGHTQAVVTRTGVNVWDEEWEVGGISADNGENVTATDRIRSKNYISVVPGVSYYFKASNTIGLRLYDGDKHYVTSTVQTNLAYTIPANIRYVRFIVLNTTTYNHDISINYPSTDQDYHPGTVASVEVQLGQTVYGGKLDVLSGVLTVDRAIVDLGTLNWSYITDFTYPAFRVYGSNAPTGIKENSAMTCTAYKFVGNFASWDAITREGNCVIGGATSAKGCIIRDDAYTDAASFKASVAGQTLAYELATPITVTLTPNELSTLLGANNIWSDAGEVTAEYRADPTLFIQRKIAEALS